MSTTLADPRSALFVERNPRVRRLWRPRGLGEIPRMRIRSAGAALLAMLSFGAAGCGSNPEPATDTAPPHFRMAVFLDDSASPSGKSITRGARGRAAELGVVLDFFDARRISGEQVRQMRDAITSDQYIGGFVVPVDPHPLCTVATDFAPDHNFMLAVTTTPICGRAADEGEAAWAPGTLTFVSASPDGGVTGSTAVQALYDARVGRTPIPRFWAAQP